MSEKYKQLSVVDICQGCKMVHDGEFGIVAGVPNEVRKYIDNAGLGSIKISSYIASDTPHANGLSYWRYEFPGFIKLFKEQGYFRNEKLNIHGTFDQLTFGRTIIRSSLLSLTDRELELGKTKFGVLDNEITSWKKVIDYFALRSLDDEAQILGVDDLFNFVEFKSLEPARVGKFTIVKEDDLNTFTIGHDAFDDVTFTLTFDKRPKPPYRIEVSDAFQEQFSLGGLPFSYGNGFDSRNGNTNWLLKLNGTEMLWDVGSFIWDHLLANGFGPQRLYNLYVSHGHEDHVGAMIGAIFFGGHFHIYGTPLVLMSTMVNFFANLKWDIFNEKYWQRIGQYFTFHPVRENETRSLFGVDFTPRRSYHTLPTAGGVFEVTADGVRYSMYVTADLTGPEKLQDMREKGVISDSDYTEAVDLIHAPHTLKICDGGGDPAQIHMSPQRWQQIAESASCIDSKFIVGHRNDLPASCDRLILAEPGKPYVACYGKPLNSDAVVFADAIRSMGVDDRAQVQALWHQGDTVRFGSRHRVVRRGERSDDVYVALAGTLEVLIDTGDGAEKRIAILQGGDYFGEMAYILDEGRNASIRAISPVRLHAFSGDAFARFVWENNLRDGLADMWTKRNMIAKIRYFQCLSASDLKKLAMECERITMPAGSILIEEGTKDDTVYGIVTGSVNIYRMVKNERVLINILGEGALVGETVGLREAETRNATVTIREESVVLKLAGTDFRHWAGKRFGLYIGLMTLIEERQASVKFMT